MKESKKENNQRTQTTNAVASQSSDNMILVLAEKFAQYEKSLTRSSSVNEFAESDKIYLITSSNKWVPQIT